MFAGRYFLFQPERAFSLDVLLAVSVRGRVEDGDKIQGDVVGMRTI